MPDCMLFLRCLASSFTVIFRSSFALFTLVAFFRVAGWVCAQSSDDTVRVTMTMNPDGSKTVYRIDNAMHESVATTTTAKGKPGGKIIYTLDDEGRYASGRVFAANGALRFKTLYRYDTAGRLAEESQLDKNDEVMHRFVYSFDGEGRASGYAVFDGAGNLLGRTTPKNTSPPPKRRAHR